MERTIKHCSRCGVCAPIDTFVKNGINRETGRQMYHSMCHPCWQSYKQERKAANKAGMGNGRRPRASVCRDCAVLLTDENGIRNGTSAYTGKVSWQNRCRDCWNTYQQGKRRPADPRVAKDRMLLWSYGLSIEEYDAMLEQQNHRCAICNRPEAEIHPKSNALRCLAVDHCHTTGRVRGLLCNACNRAIGLLGESTQLLTAAIGYLTTTY